VRTFYAWCADQQLDPLTIRRVHLDAYTRHLESPQPATGRSAARSSIARALSALSGLYAYAVDEGILDSSPAARSKRRPKIVKNSQSTGLTRDEGRRLLAAAAADGFRSHALISLLINIGLRIDEALSRDVEHLGSARGHQVLMLHRKGGASDVAPLAPATAAALRCAATSPTVTAAPCSPLARGGGWTSPRRGGWCAGSAATPDCPSRG